MLHKFSKRLFVIHCSLFTVLLFGCNRGAVLFPLSGTVTYNGAAVEVGNVVFTPDSSKGNTGQQIITAIENGRYKTEIPGGAMIVSISGVHHFKDTPEGRLGEAMFEPWETRIDFPKQPGEHNFEVPKK